MNDLTPHQRDILIAMLQGRDIEVWRGSFWVKTDYFDVLQLIGDSDERLRIAPNQDEAVRLYGDIENDVCVLGTVRDNDTHYIDISPDGFIIGGKIEATT